MRPIGMGSPGRSAEQIANALHGGVAIGFRVFRQELVRDQRPVGPPPDHVGEGAAAVDPEVPASGPVALRMRHASALNRRQVLHELAE